MLIDLRNNTNILQINNEDEINIPNYENSEYIITSLPSNFDFNIYKKLNPDLSSFDKKELKLHYIKYGFYENRLYKYYDNVTFA